MPISFRERAPEIGEIDLVLFWARIVRDEVRAMIPKSGCRVVVTDSAARLYVRSGCVAEMHEPDTGKAPACRLDKLFHRGRNGMPRVGGIVPWPKVRLTRRGAYKITLGKVEVGVGKEQLIVTVTLIEEENLIWSYGVPKCFKKRRLLPVIVSTRMPSGKHRPQLRWQVLESKRVEKQSGITASAHAGREVRRAGRPEFRVGEVVPQGRPARHGRPPAERQ